MVGQNVLAGIAMVLSIALTLILAYFFGQAF